MIQEKWMPVISEHTMRYKRSLNLFQKYEVRMEITDWDDKVFYMTHSFVVGDRILAQGTSKGCVINKQGVIPPEEVMQKVREKYQNRAV